jgi:GAF domain-containing protein
VTVAASLDDGLLDELAALLDGEPDPIARAANLASLLYHRLPDVNWVGFYFLRGDTLVLGPFQGQPACTRIPVGQGVCGTAWARRETLVVPDVHEFPGHIACDAASRSEIVVPLPPASPLAGVLDIDSPRPNRFTFADRALVERAAAIYAA